MHVKVKGSQEVKVLRLIEENTGVNYAREFIGLTSGFDDWQVDIDGFYVLDPEEYNHWSNLFSENIRALILLNEHKSFIRSEAYQEIYHTETRGFEHFKEVSLDNLDRITSGTVSCKMISVKDDDGLAIRKAVDVEVLENSEHGNNLELTGLFILSTQYNKYELVVSVLANFSVVEGAIEVEMLEYEDAPFGFSATQAETIEGVFIKEAKRQLTKSQLLAPA